MSFLAHCSEAHKITKSLFLTEIEERPPGSLCALFNIKVKEFKSDELDISKIISDLPPIQSDYFKNSFKVSFPDTLLSDFGFNKSSSSEQLLKCAEKIMNMIFGKCLKLDKTETNNTRSDEITENVGEPQDENDSCGHKRRSGDPDESNSKKLKLDESCLYQPSSSWTLWNLVWPRRKQIALETAKGDMSVMEWEAAITEAIIGVCISE